MRPIITTFVFFIVLSLAAQHTISGTFSPPKAYTWLIAYQLTPEGETYTADTEIKNGKFELKMPEDTPLGSYRFVYAVPQEEFYFDIIYNGKEDIILDFNAETGVQFIQSKENRTFNSYFTEINQWQQQLVSFYTEGKNDVNAFEDILQKLKSIQRSFEKESEGLLCQAFIKANRSYTPDTYVSVFDYVKRKKDTYFDDLDIDNPQLQASGFLTDKLTNYVFTALPLKKMTPSEIEKAMQDNLDTVAQRLVNTGNAYKFHVFHSAWLQATNNEFTHVADFILKNYLEKWAISADQQTVIEEIETAKRLRIGAIAPEISWKDDSSNKKLSTLSGADRYLLVFWSSTCSHCLKELPALHKRLSLNSNVKVIAVGLEDEEDTWKKESAKLNGFEHVISLGKWESEYAQTYAIDHTPTYFILDSDKKIIAKPDSDKEVVAFLEK